MYVVMWYQMIWNIFYLEATSNTFLHKRWNKVRMVRDQQKSKNNSPLQLQPEASMCTKIIQAYICNATTLYPIHILHITMVLQYHHCNIHAIVSQRSALFTLTYRDISETPNNKNMHNTQSSTQSLQPLRGKENMNTTKSTENTNTVLLTRLLCCPYTFVSK